MTEDHHAARRVVSAEVDERTCAACGYSLRGLAVGANCPECGTTTSPVRLERLDDPLSRAPIPVIRAILIRTILLLVTLPACLAIQSGLVRVGLPGLPFGIAAAIAWSLAAVVALAPMTDPQAAWHGLAVDHVPRRIGRWVQVLWIPSILAQSAIRDGWASGLAIPAFAAAAACTMATMFAFVAVWERVGAWTRDSLASALLGAVPWLVLAAAFLRPVFIVAAAFAAYALVTMAVSQYLSILHHGEEVERIARRRRRDLAYWRKVDGLKGDRTQGRSAGARVQGGREGGRKG